MAKTKKKDQKKGSNKYNEKLSVKGSFLDIMKAASKDAKSKSKKPS